jgi:hypothetical protein
MFMCSNLFLRPAPWGISPGPASVHSVDHAMHTVEIWLTLIPDRAESRPLRRRMLALRDLLAHARNDPSEADLQSAKLAIKGTVRFARHEAQRRALAEALAQINGPLH